MASRTTGQHILPRLLLRGFVAFGKNREEYTFLFRRQTTIGIPSNIKDAGKRRLFYGEPEETGVEESLQKEESRFAPAVRRTRANGQIMDGDLDPLLELIANLSIRTHHLRVGMADSAKKVFGTAQEIFTGEKAAEVFRHSIRSQPNMLRDALRNEIRKTPNFPREPYLHLLLERWFEGLVSDYLRRGEMPPGVDVEALFSQVAGLLDWNELATKGQIRSLQHGVSPKVRVDFFRTFKWSVRRAASGAFILGDFGPLGLPEGGGEPQPLYVLGPKVSSILLPLSDDLLLQGLADEPPILEYPELREATAKRSADFFVAAHDGPEERRLIPLIGTASKPLSASDCRSIGEQLIPPGPKDDRGEDAPPETTTSFEIAVDGTPTNSCAACDELTRFTETFKVASAEHGPAMDTRLRILVTDDLKQAVEGVGEEYGYQATIRLGDRAIPVWAKALYRQDYPPLCGTIVVHSGLWDNDDPTLFAARAQLVLSQIMMSISTGRALLTADSSTETESPTHQRELEAIADQAIEIHDAQHYALPLLGCFVSATDENGDPAAPADRLAWAYLAGLGEILGQMGQIVKNVIQKYRVTSEGLELILPAAEPVVHELMIVVGYLVGLSSDKMLARCPGELSACSGFREYLEDQWGEIVSALRDEARLDARQSIAKAIRGIFSNMGLYVDDLEDGRRDIIVGTPRFIEETSPGE